MIFLEDNSNQCWPCHIQSLPDLKPAENHPAVNNVSRAPSVSDLTNSRIGTDEVGHALNHVERGKALGGKLVYDVRGEVIIPRRSISACPSYG